MIKTRNKRKNNIATGGKIGALFIIAIIVFFLVIEPVLPTANKYRAEFIEGALMTLKISTLGTFLGVIIGMVIASLRLLNGNNRDNDFVLVIKYCLRKIATAYIDIVRGTPMLLQSLIFWQLFNSMGVSSLFVIALVVVTLNTAAYAAEVIRAGINAIDKGQLEAARSLGMTHIQAMKKVILPQAFKNSIPAIGNELIVNVKDTSVLSVIGLFELMRVANVIGSSTYNLMTPLIIAGSIYLFLSFTLTRILYFIDSKLNLDSKRKSSFPTSQTTPEVV